MPSTSLYLENNIHGTSVHAHGQVVKLSEYPWWGIQFSYATIDYIKRQLCPVPECLECSHYALHATTTPEFQWLIKQVSVDEAGCLTTLIPDPSIQSPACVGIYIVQLEIEELLTELGIALGDNAAAGEVFIGIQLDNVMRHNNCMVWLREQGNTLELYTYWL